MIIGELLYAIFLLNRVMDRERAIALLEELMTTLMIQPSRISLHENQHGGFDLLLDVNEIGIVAAFVSKKGLVMAVNKETSYCIISRP